MAKIFIFVIVCFACAFAIENDTISTIDKFSMQIHKVISELESTYPEGSFISALSIQHSLALWSTAAKNKNISDDFFEHVLLNNTRQQVFQDLAKISAFIKTVTGEFGLQLFSKLYFTSLGELMPSFNVSLDQFGTETERVEFREPASVINNINTWIGDKSQDQLVELAKPNSYDARTFVVNLNALYLNAKWKNSFENQETEQKSFHVTTNETYEVTMMRLNKEYLYAVNEELNATIIEMPYTMEDCRMIVVLPSSIDGLKDVMAKLATNGLNQHLVGKLKPTQVKLYFPKFKLETELKVMKELPKLGLKELLTSPLQNLINSADLYMNTIQKTVIDFDATGTQATAGTDVEGKICSRCSEPVTYVSPGVGSGTGGIPPSPPPETSFIVDHPFMFAIMKGEVVVSTGTVLKPTPAEDKA